MRRTPPVLVFTLALLIIVIETQSPIVAKANPINMPSVPAVQISFPLSSIGGYVNSTVEFEVYVNMLIESPTLNSISYSLDGKPSVSLEDLEVTSYVDYGPDKIDFKTYTAKISLRDLSEGNHTLAAYANDMSASRDFAVNSYYHVAALKVLSPTDQVYTAAVPVIFVFDGELNNAHYYLYKGYESVTEETLGGNTTLDNLPNGSYDLYLFVTTEFGQASEAIHFSVLNSSQVENLPVIVAVLVLLVLTIVFSLLVYFKKLGRGKTE